MRVRKHPSYFYSYLLSLVAIIGIPMSALVSTDEKWQHWHLSRLGEGGTLSAFIFNGTLICGAFIMLLLADALLFELKVKLPQHRSKILALHTALMSIGACWLGLAVFPFDIYPFVHNIFGYSMFMIVCLMMLAMPRLLPDAPRVLHRFALFSVLLTALLMSLHLVLGVLTLLIVEAFGGLLLFVWLIHLTRYVSYFSRE